MPGYGGGPNYPKKPGGNKALVIVIAAIAAVVVIGGAIVAFTLLSKKDKTSLSDNSPTPSVSASVSAEPSVEPSPSEEPSPSPSEEESPSPSEDVQPSESPADATDALSIFDSETADNVLTAFDEIKLDADLVKGLDYYNDWVDGSAYSFTYKNSVVDMLIHDDGTVFSIESSGTQVYLESYEPYDIGDYLGGKAHYDEAVPTAGYFFYVAPNLTNDSLFDIDVADDNGYVVQVLDPADGTLICAFYMDNSTPMSINIPAGTYDIQFAAGTDWQGIDDLFGPDTQYFALDDTVTVSTDAEQYLTLDITGGSGATFHEIDPNA
jgi:hypothetical protein